MDLLLIIVPPKLKMSQFLLGGTLSLSALKPGRLLLSLPCPKKVNKEKALLSDALPCTGIKRLKQLQGFAIS
ncbi:MAG: hypothetical protein MH137_12755 [Flavobacteriales bacterium]|nr:hypothetical protein [Flavobacteriales bacterium]